MRFGTVGLETQIDIIIIEKMCRSCGARRLRKHDCIIAQETEDRRSKIEKQKSKAKSKQKPNYNDNKERLMR